MDYGAIIPWKWPGRIFAEKSGVLEWLDGQPPPSQMDLDAAALEYQMHLDASLYQRQRKEEYPPMHELVVALWEHLVEGRSEMATKLQAQRDAVKAKYPKGG